MKQVKAGKYIEGVESIYVEQPAYETGHDGSDGKCDCIGMCRGALERAGATDVKNMRGTNQAARKTILNLQKLTSSAQLCVGDVVLKTRDKDDKSMPLPDRYRKGGSDYDGKLGEVNFTHIGTVTEQVPLVITHMTSPTAKKDKSIKNWTWFGELPWVEYEEVPEPPPEPDLDPGGEAETATVWAESGKTVKMRAEPSTKCRMYWDVPVGSEVIVDSWGDEWSRITWNHTEGWMMSRFLRTEEAQAEVYRVTVRGLPKETAEELCMMFPGAEMEKEVR